MVWMVWCVWCGSVCRRRGVVCVCTCVCTLGVGGGVGSSLQERIVLTGQQKCLRAYMQTTLVR